MKRLSVVLLSFLVLLPAAHAATATESGTPIETQVLRIFSTKISGYYHKPWKAPDFSQLKASGFFFKDDTLFPGKRGLIFTNAHAVSMAQDIKVSNGREKRRYDVQLLTICESADFAVLQMPDEEIKAYEQYNGPIVPLELGNSDPLRVGDKVMGWGYPLGGERISKSEQGEISRIEVSRYVYSQDQWLMVQASLQQNRGNSGGPVLKDGKVVGIAFQGMQTSDRINYFIPVNMVKNLIPLLPDRALIPQWDWVLQHLFAPLKNYYGLGADQGGVLISYVVPGGGPYRFGLRSNDILMEIDGHEIDNFGEIFFPPLGQKVFLTEILNRKKVGDPLTLKVRREGKLVTVQGNVSPGLPRLVPRIFTDANYFVCGAVGFVELTVNCLDNLGKSGESFRAKYADDLPEKAYEKIVIISEIFPEYGLVETTQYLQRVEKIDGEDVLNIEQLYDKIEAARKAGRKSVLLEIHEKTQLPLDLTTSAELDKRIQAKYGILYMKTPGGFIR